MIILHTFYTFVAYANYEVSAEQAVSTISVCLSIRGSVSYWNHVKTSFQRQKLFGNLFQLMSVN